MSQIQICGADDGNRTRVFSRKLMFCRLNYIGMLDQEGLAPSPHQFDEMGDPWKRLAATTAAALAVIAAPSRNSHTRRGRRRTHRSGPGHQLRARADRHNRPDHASTSRNCCCTRRRAAAGAPTLARNTPSSPAARCRSRPPSSGASTPYLAGQAIFIPAGVPHIVRSDSPHDANAVVTYTLPADVRRCALDAPPSMPMT